MRVRKIRGGSIHDVSWAMCTKEIVMALVLVNMRKVRLSTVSLALR